MLPVAGAVLSSWVVTWRWGLKLAETAAFGLLGQPGTGGSVRVVVAFVLRCGFVAILLLDCLCPGVRLGTLSLWSGIGLCAAAAAPLLLLLFLDYVIQGAVNFPRADSACKIGCLGSVECGFPGDRSGLRECWCFLEEEGVQVRPAERCASTLGKRASCMCLNWVFLMWDTWRKIVIPSSKESWSTQGRDFNQRFDQNSWQEALQITRGKRLDATCV